jgi:hypothetical protein
MQKQNNMKTPRTVLTFLLLCANYELIFSQDHLQRFNFVRIESGYAFTGSGDLDGYFISNEYGRYIGNRIRIGPSVSFFKYSGIQYDVITGEGFLMQSADCIGLDFTGYYLPVKTNTYDIEAGLGAYIRNWHWICATGPDVSFSSTELNLGPGSFGDFYKTAPGYTVSLGLVLKTGGKLYFNIRGVYQNDTNGDNSVTGRLGLNFGF